LSCATNANMTWHSVKWNVVCPKKHFGSVSSCLAYFMLRRTYEESEAICQRFSNNLVSLETLELWNELIAQLEELELYEYKFRVGLQRRRLANKK
jgi:hypothetical protein